MKLIRVSFSKLDSAVLSGVLLGAKNAIELGPRVVEFPSLKVYRGEVIYDVKGSVRVLF